MTEEKELKKTKSEADRLKEELSLLRGEEISEKKTENVENGTTTTNKALSQPKLTSLLGGHRTEPSTPSTSTPPKRLGVKMKAS